MLLFSSLSLKRVDALSSPGWLEIIWLLSALAFGWNLMFHVNFYFYLALDFPPLSVVLNLVIGTQTDHLDGFRHFSILFWGPRKVFGSSFGETGGNHYKCLQLGWLRFPKIQCGLDLHLSLRGGPTPFEGTTTFCNSTHLSSCKLRNQASRRERREGGGERGWYCTSVLVTNSSCKGAVSDTRVEQSWCAHWLHFYASVIRVGVNAEVTSDLDFM